MKSKILEKLREFAHFIWLILLSIYMSINQQL